MARVTAFEQITKERPTVHGTTRCTYCVFDGREGKSYLMLETYGSKSRQFVNKVSQSVQLDEEAAAHLISILKKAFPNLRSK